ncbi:MAG: lytic transglycosylase domain-containing protein [Syntrophobacteraceae bacterium]
MAPDSRLWRHQLGGASTNWRRFLLSASLPFILLLHVLTVNVEARTELVVDRLGEIRTPLLAVQNSSGSDSASLSSLSISTKVFRSIPASPAGQSSNRNQIHIPDHPTIQKYVRLYKGQQRESFAYGLDRSWSLVPIMADILESQGVPADLAYIPMVESHFKGKASYKGAKGYWQLLAGTARDLGLRVDRWVDERNDPIKSTQAAAKYLRSFYEQFNSWPLALAAYNAGGGPVLSAMRRCRTENVWDLAKRGGLPRRTSAYVAKVFAAIQIARDLENHGFDSPGDYRLYDFESLRVGAPLKLDQVAKWLDVPVNELRNLNPSLNLDQVPPNTYFDLRLPSGARDKFDVAYGDYLNL